MSDPVSATRPQRLVVAGIGVWAPGLPDWDTARRVLRGEMAAPAGASSKPPPSTLLPAAERRRAPTSVTLALGVAKAACDAAGADPARLPAVFSSAGGDLEITDYLCQVLAESPALLSPTRFHHSVHNAAVGYWTIATGCMAPSLALAAGDTSFAAGLFEATSMVQAEARPVLMVAYDIAATGPLAQVTAHRAAFGVALVLAPEGSAEGAVVELAWQGHAPGDTGIDALPAPWHELAARTPAARALTLLHALAVGDGQPRRFALGPALTLQVQMQLQAQVRGPDEAS